MEAKNKTLWFPSKPLFLLVHPNYQTKNLTKLGRYVFQRPKTSTDSLAKFSNRSCKSAYMVGLVTTIQNKDRQSTRKANITKLDILKTRRLYRYGRSIQYQAEKKQRQLGAFLLLQEVSLSHAQSITSHA